MAAADPTVSIVFFLILTLAYSIFKYYTKSPKTIQLWTIIYFLILIVVQFFINVGLTKEICGFEQYGVALQQTIIPWVFVFGLLNILLMVFPNWLNPFSNTIGYLFASITGVNGFLKVSKIAAIGLFSISLVMLQCVYGILKSIFYLKYLPICEKCSIILSYFIQNLLGH